MAKDKRIRKFNGEANALLCNGCRVIVKEGWDSNAWAVEVHKPRGTYPGGLITQLDWDSKEPLYCEECKKKNELI